jgi:hypothetical protein
MFTEKNWEKRLTAKINDKFISIIPYSGYSLSIADFTQPEFLLDPSISDGELGRAVLESLKNSRFLELEKSYELEDICKENYSKWVVNLMEKYGYKTKKALFKNMLSCSVRLEDGILVIRPSHHEKLEGWGGNDETERNKVYVPFDAPPAEIGAALRLAFSRCTTKF